MGTHTDVILQAVAPLFLDPLCKVYNLVSEEGSDLTACEVMAVTEYSYKLPAALLDLYMADEQQLADEMKSLGKMSAQWNDRKYELVRRHDNVLTSYRQARQDLLGHQGPFFKRSTIKGDARWEFVPVNLHLQRMCAENASLSRSGVYDVITVGAFTAFAQKYKDGGLLRYAHLLSRTPDQTCCCLPAATDRASVASGTAGPGRTSSSSDVVTKSAVYLAETAVDNVENARCKIMDSMLELLAHVDGSDKTGIEVQLNELQMQSESIKSTLQSHVVSESLQFLQQQLETGAAPCLAPLAPPACASDAALGAALGTADGVQLSLYDTVHQALTTSVVGMESKVLVLLQQLGDSGQSETEPPQQNGYLEVSEWRERLVPALREVRVDCDAALAAVRLVRAVARLREDRRTQQLRDAARRRRDVCFTHAVTAASVALLTALWCRDPDPEYMRLLATVGPLLQFEGLLSYYGNEAAMIQDMVVAVNDLSAVQFVLKPVEPGSRDSASDLPEVAVEGGRGRLVVHLPAPAHLLASTSQLKSAHLKFSVCPVFFNVGINEQATFVEYVGNTGPQRACNRDSYLRLVDYITSCQERNLLASLDGAVSNFDKVRPSVPELLAVLGAEVRSDKAKNVAVLQLASEITRRVRGLRFTSCKSAKDRTSMSVTLEQVNILCDDFHLASAERQRILHVMRAEGTRRKNTEKNVGSPRYSFNTLQLLTVPEEYRPPPGTYGAVES